MYSCSSMGLSSTLRISGGCWTSRFFHSSSSSGLENSKQKIITARARAEEYLPRSFHFESVFQRASRRTSGRGLDLIRPDLLRRCFPMNSKNFRLYFEESRRNSMIGILV